MDKDSFEFEKSFETIEIEKPDYAHNPTQQGGDPTAATFELEKIKVIELDKFPLELDIISEIQNILAAGVFRNIENPILYDKVCDMVLSERYSNLVEGLFWTIFVVKFQATETDLHETLKKHLGNLYSEYFSLLQQPKEELSNFGIFGAAYICHIMFFNLFAKESHVFDMRFILDCYHIVIHEVNGIFVSDFYIQTSIERIFGNKFFHFERRAEKKKKIVKKDFRTEPLLRDLSYDLKDLPYVPGGLDLAQELSTKLRVGQKGKKGTSNNLELPDSYHHVRSHSIAVEKVLKLTQPNEDKSFTLNGDNVPYFPKMRFNCHQISPTVSSFLDNSTNTLPFQKRKVINYTNNKVVAESGPLIYQPSLEIREPKSEKKEKKKNVQKGSVSDYKLSGRADDYYLDYMPKAIKNKFKMALDMKYILDNVKPRLKGNNSVKGVLDGAQSRKFLKQIRNIHKSQDAIREDVDEDEAATPELERHETMKLENSMEVSFRRDKKDEIQEVSESDKKRKGGMEDSAMGESFLPLLKSKVKQASVMLEFGGGGSSSSKHSLKKNVSFFSRMEDAKSPSAQQAVVEDLTNKFMGERLKFSNAANKKLGKGRFFVSLTDHEDPVDEAQKRLGKKYEYKDNRKTYVAAHDGLIRKDVDANIENIVHNLMVKKTRFNKSFARLAPLGK